MMGESDEGRVLGIIPGVLVGMFFALVILCTKQLIFTFVYRVIGDDATVLAS